MPIFWVSDPPQCPSIALFWSWNWSRCIPSERGPGRNEFESQPLALGRGDLVSDPLPNDLPLELGQREKDIEGQSHHAGGGIEGLGDADKGCSVGIEQLHQHCEVGQGPGQPVHLIDHHDIQPARPDVG